VRGSGRERIFLIDAMSFIFRAYHAMARGRAMTNKAGVPTAAVLVFVNMLRKLRDDFRPEYLAAVFDIGAPSIRDRMAANLKVLRKFDSKTQSFQDVEYKGYKANRDEMPQELIQQVPYIRRALEGYRVPILQAEEYEADDVIGTLAREAAPEYDVYVVSNDKDMLQLVDEHVLVLNPPKDNLICDAAKVEEIVGVPPSQIVDVMALRGDSVDNVPGAPGIGDKGSVEIIRRFGSVEAALDRAAEIEKKSYRESLQENREAVLISKELVTIDTNVPIELEVEPMRSREPDSELLRPLFTELEFNSLLRELLPAAEVAEGHYTEATQKSEVESVLASVPPGLVLAVAVEAANGEIAESDEETDDASQGAMLPLQHGLALGGGEVVLPKVAISPRPGEDISAALDGETGEALRAALADGSRPKSIHDYKAALHMLGAHGIALAGVEHDPMLYSYLLDPTYTSHRLPDVVLRHMHRRMGDSLAEAADMTGRMAQSLRRQVDEAGLTQLYKDMDLPLVPVLARMEEAGVKVDLRVLDEMSSRLEREAGAKAREIYEAAGVEFNINSPKQLGDVLFNKLSLSRPVKYGKGKTVSTAVDVLEGLAEDHAVPRMVLDYRQLTKLKSTYVDALPALVNPATGRVHTTFGQTGTATGRLSSTNPNLQNIPVRTELGREIRAAFIAEPGHVLLSADYSQVELRLLAHYSRDPLLVEAYRRGDDIHTLTASQVFGVPPLMVTPDHRRQAKVVNFGIVYGLSAFGLAQGLGIERSEAKQFIDAYFAKYQGVRAFIDKTLDETRRDQHVKTLFGRVRPIPDINSRNPNQRGFAERTAVNTPLQGTAADLIKLAMIRIDAELRRRGMKSRMTLQVHDELVFEAPEDEVDDLRRLVKDKMENAYPLHVPLLVEIGVGPNWRDLE
jgi:DNA polymerase-1